MTPPQDLEVFDAHPEWRLLLTAYAERHAQATAEWLPRIANVEGLPAEQMSVVHGRLMALGFLGFELGTRTEGLQYQLTAAGKQALLPPEARRTAEMFVSEEVAAPEPDEAETAAPHAPAAVAA